MTHAHAYRSRLSWRGSTDDGYEKYDRTHRVTVPPAGGELVLSSDPAFNGDERLPNPEQLLLAAASSCQLLSFLAIAARSRIDVLSYEDDADAVMPEDERPMRITHITLRPKITVAAGADPDRVLRLIEKAHKGCFIANTLNAEIMLEPVIEHAASRPAAELS
jgi:organic hydroperoxide reductase OsmC/OhrA